MPAGREEPVIVPYVEHCPQDITAIFWLKNRDPQHWRDSQQLEHVLSKYIISDTPMTEEQWARGPAGLDNRRRIISSPIGKHVMNLPWRFPRSILVRINESNTNNLR
jgi:hypothetical protein